MRGEFIKKARVDMGLAREEVAKKLGVNMKVITQLETDKMITENIVLGDLLAALSYLFQVPYSFLSNGEEGKKDQITTGDIVELITDDCFLSWSAKGLLMHIFRHEDFGPSFNTIQQYSGDNYQQTKSALEELVHFGKIFKYQTLGEIEVYGFNYLNICSIIRTGQLMSR